MNKGERIAIVAGLVGFAGLLPSPLTAADMPELIRPKAIGREVTPRQERRLAAKRARKAAQAQQGRGG